MTIELITLTCGLYTFFLGYIVANYRRHVYDTGSGRTWWQLVPIHITAIPYLAGMILVAASRDVYPAGYFWAFLLIAFVLWSAANYINNCSGKGTRYYLYVLVGPTIYFGSMLVLFYMSRTVFGIQ